MDELEVLAARWAFGEIPPGELPNLAVSLLADGHESRSLLLLVGTSPGDLRWEGPELFERTLQELGHPSPSREEAAWLLARHYAEEIVADGMPPIAGAQAIWNIWEELGRPADLTIFVGLASEWEDHSAYREAYDSDIRDEATKLLARMDRPRPPQHSNGG